MSVRTRADSGGGSGVAHGALYDTDLFTELFSANRTGIQAKEIIRTIPYVPKTTRTVNGIYFVATTPSVNVLAGIYADNGNTPIGGARLAVSASTPAVINSVNFITIPNTSLIAGTLYYIAFNFDAAEGTALQGVSWMQEGTTVGEPRNWSNAIAAYALPDPYPAGAVAATDMLSCGVRVVSIP